MELGRDTLLKSSMLQLFLRLSIPNMLGMLAMAVYYLVDAMLVGQFVGSVGLAGVSIIVPLTIILNSPGFFIGGGASAKLARALGENDQETLQRIVGFSIFWTLILSILTSVGIYTFFESLLAPLGANEPQLRELATTYGTILIYATPFSNMVITLTMLLRGQGRMRQSTGILFAGTLVNLVLDYIFLATFGMGVAGAAWATLIAQIVKLTITLKIMGSETCPITWPKPHLAILKESASVGLSAIAMQLMSFLQLSILYRTASAYGSTTTIAVMGATIQVLNFGFTILWGLAQGCLPVIGVSHGANLHSRVLLALQSFIMYLSIASLGLWSVIILAPQTVLGLFLSENSVIKEYSSLFQISLSGFCAYGFILGLFIYLQGIGKGMAASMILVSRLVLFFLPLALILPSSFGIKGLFTAIAAGDLLTFLLCTLFYLAHRKQLRLTAKLPNIQAEAT